MITTHTVRPAAIDLAVAIRLDPRAARAAKGLVLAAFIAVWCLLSLAS
jgi:hypothetical protein